MRTESLNSTNFQGKLIIVNSLSNKPKKCIKKVQDNIQQLIKPKDFDLYLMQDYSKSKVNISAKYPINTAISKNLYLTCKSEENIPDTSKHSTYIDAAKSVIESFENNVRKVDELVWKQEQKKQKIDDVKNIIEYVLLFPVFAAELLIHDINPKWGTKFDKLLEKIGI